MTQSYPGGPLLVITGPTASGKTGLALAVAEKFGGTIINSDSMQVYRELRVVTARPSAAEETRALTSSMASCRRQNVTLLVVGVRWPFKK